MILPIHFDTLENISSVVKAGKDLSGVTAVVAVRNVLSARYRLPHPPLPI